MSGLIGDEDIKAIEQVHDYGHDGLDVVFSGGRKVHVPFDLNNPDWHIAQEWLAKQRKG